MRSSSYIYMSGTIYDIALSWTEWFHCDKPNVVLRYHEYIWNISGRTYKMWMVISFVWYFLIESTYNWTIGSSDIFYMPVFFLQIIGKICSRELIILVFIICLFNRWPSGNTIVNLRWFMSCDIGQKIWY